MSVGNHIQWQEVEAAASKMFAVWTSGGELEWAKECWGHLSQAGLTGDSTVVETTASHLRLVALARIYQEFCGCAWDENPETDAHTLAEDLEIDPVALGILAAGTGKGEFDDAGDDYELCEAALLAVTDAMRDELFACLAKAYGDEIKLYSRMAQTNHTPYEDDDGDEFEVTGPNSTAYGFVTEGFRK
jgi:hypothetical protein